MRLRLTPAFERMAKHETHAPAGARFVFGPLPARALVDDVLEMSRRCPPEAAAGAAEGMLHYDVRDRLPDVSVPTTVLCGTRDLVTTHRENRAIAAAIPGGRFVSAPGAGHMIIWEDPALIADEITRAAE